MRMLWLLGMLRRWRKRSDCWLKWTGLFEVMVWLVEGTKVQCRMNSALGDANMFKHVFGCRDGIHSVNWWFVESQNEF